MRIICLNIVLMVFAAQLSAQSYTISGKITDTEKVPLSGVNIVVTGTGLGTYSDAEGYYKIDKIPSGNYNLKFSAVGYENVLRDITLKDGPVILNIIMIPKAIQTDQVIVTAGKRQQYLSDLPVSADVIQSDEFSKKNLSNLENALRYVPGVNMTEDQISIRGSSGYSRGAGSRVLLALDGIPFYTGDTGETIWEMIPTPVIQRVEIIKGAASSLYGSTAIGGVVNVITSDIPEKPATFFNSFIGVYSRPSYDGWKWSDENRYFNGLTL
ncbi:MAG TPA: TonB-dependent receptor plug domain-containing protein, partial [Ignavibacteriaceae bacterium]